MDIERAKQALVAADAAGDTQAATKLARFIREQQPQWKAETHSMDDPSELGSAYRGIEQGLTGSFADEAKAAVGAGVAKLFGGNATDDMSYSDLYSEALAGLNKELERDIEVNPKSTIAGNVVGGLLGAGKLASTKAGASLGNSLRTGNLATRAAKGAAVGATTGSIYGAGAAREGQRLEGARQGGLYGGVAGGVIPAVGAGLSKLNTKTIIPTAQKIREEASKAYLKAEKLGGQMRPEFSNELVNKARKLLLSSDELVNQMKSNKPMRDAFEDIASFQGKPMTLQRAQALDEQLSNMIDGFFDATKGGLDKNGKRLLDLQSEFRSMLEKADDGFIQGSKEGFESVKQGRKLWAASRRLNDIERIIDNARFYDVPSKAIKTGFRTLLKNQKRIGAYAPEEVRAIKRAAKTGDVTDLLNVAGSRLAPIVAGGSGYAAAGPLGGAGAFITSQALTSTARRGAEKIQRGRANKVLESIANRAGLTEQTKRIDSDTLRKIMSLPPKEAKELMKQMSIPAATQQVSKPR